MTKESLIDNKKELSEFINESITPKDLEKKTFIENGRPGSACPKKFVALNKEFTEKGICTASRQYQHLKLKELDNENLTKDEYQMRYNKIIEYDHSINLWGYSKVKESSVVNDVLTLDLDPFEIAHLLLSEEGRSEALYEKYQAQNLFNLIKSEIAVKKSVFSVNANIYYSLYSLQ